jgi:hypothetical protein
MTIKDIEDLTKSYIGLKNINETLINCLAKQSIVDITTRYFPQTHIEEIFTESTKIFLSTLEKKPLEILSIKNNGKKVAFKTYPTFINLKTDLIDSPQWLNGKSGLKLEIEYNFLPEFIDDVTDIEINLPTKVFALSAASEYMFVNGLFSESAAFDMRFKEAVAIIKQAKPTNKTMGATSMFL